MSVEDVSYWSMLGTWLAAIATTLAVLVALFLPSYQKKQNDIENNRNAKKLLRSQLVNINENAILHQQSLAKTVIAENPVFNFNYLPHEVLSALSSAELTNIYKLKSDLDLAEQLRKSALQASKVNPSGENTIFFAESYSEYIDKLVLKTQEALRVW
ncbi:hypothetical protein A165_17105 [Vibrio tasmaniensis ZS-17]|uniref:hypothetical protein n=1 Tax=Vibrio tasmaniensis TaxID=212663 RepID=UPI0002E8ADEE|nr:hypothetical protein [Vibrio tasmaniensis]OED61192.1 hypothetical protein A165_17105 [Vibrio tasmaniensis ZS-17]